MKVFIPFSEALVEKLGLSIGDLVPFQLEYQCLRINSVRENLERLEPEDDATTAEVRA